MMMLGKLIYNSFRRDLRKKIVAMSAVMLATSLATFLLNWSLNLGDKIQRDLRAYGANILIVPAGESLPVSAGNIDLHLNSGNYLKYSDFASLEKIFWRNQIVAFSPILPQQVIANGNEVTLVGTEFGEREKDSNFAKAAPYLKLDGRWPSADNQVVCGSSLAEKYGWHVGQQLRLQSGSNTDTFTITGIVHSGAAEERQLFARIGSVQKLSAHPGEFKQLLVSALVSPQNELYHKYQQDPKALNSQEMERYSCTPYIDSVAADITKVFGGSEARVVRQVSQSEQKITQKVNWLMALVTLAALVASSLTMTSTVTAMILERRKELALMKAIGSQNGFILFYLLAEIFLLGAAGSLGGYGLGSLLSVGLSKSIFQSVFELKPVVLPIVGFVGMLIILAGSVWPLRRVTVLQPADALKDL